MIYLYGIQFSKSDKLQYFISEEDIPLNSFVVCETPRGIEMGSVNTQKKDTNEEDVNTSFSTILRRANEEDEMIYKKNLQEAIEAISIVQSQADKLNLGMKVIDAEYTLDRTKLMISYFSDERVDFRELLKVLASLYHCRIELRQIGPRDKAKMIGGIGLCGLPLCCSSFLNEFDGISITMAKNQMLTLNIPKLSGHCGKLICCLKYEDETYSIEKKDLPRIGLRVSYNDAIYRIASINIITKIVRLENQDSVENVPLSEIEDKILYNYNPNEKKVDFPVEEKKVEEVEEQIEIEQVEIEEEKETLDPSDEEDLIRSRILSSTITNNPIKEEKEQNSQRNNRRHNNYRRQNRNNGNYQNNKNQNRQNNPMNRSRNNRNNNRYQNQRRDFNKKGSEDESN